jgi:hypothetical protein
MGELFWVEHVYLWYTVAATHAVVTNPLHVELQLRVPPTYHWEVHAWPPRSPPSQTSDHSFIPLPQAWQDFVQLPHTVPQLSLPALVPTHTLAVIAVHDVVGVHQQTFVAPAHPQVFGAVQEPHETTVLQLFVAFQQFCHQHVWAIVFGVHELQLPLLHPDTHVWMVLKLDRPQVVVLKSLLCTSLPLQIYSVVGEGTFVHHPHDILLQMVPHVAALLSSHDDDWLADWKPHQLVPLQTGVAQ